MIHVDNYVYGDKIAWITESMKKFAERCPKNKVNLQVDLVPMGFNIPYPRLGAVGERGITGPYCGNGNGMKRFDESELVLNISFVCSPAWFDQHKTEISALHSSPGLSGDLLDKYSFSYAKEHRNYLMGIFKKQPHYDILHSLLKDSKCEQELTVKLVDKLGFTVLERVTEENASKALETYTATESVLSGNLNVIVTVRSVDLDINSDILVSILNTL